MFLADHLTLDAPRRTAEGYVAVRAKAARVGVQDYLGREVDPEGKHFAADERVPVYRPADQVFDAKSAHSFIGKPITDDHPAESVTSVNWRTHSRGHVMGAKWEEGGYLAFDLLLTDAAAIAALDAGKRELSGGYDCKLAIGDGITPDGKPYKATQTNITGNHIALVNAGRAGPDCRIGDTALCDALPANILDHLPRQETPVKTMLIDGLTVDIANADTALATITTILAARDAALGKVTVAETQAVTDAATIVARDADIVRLTAAVAAAKPTLTQLRDAGKAFGIIEAKAKAAGVTVTDAMDETAIMKAVVDKAMPGNTYTGDHVGIAFAALTKDVKLPEARSTLDQALSLGVTNIGDAAGSYATARAKHKQDLRDAFRQPAPAAA